MYVDHLHFSFRVFRIVLVLGSLCLNVKAPAALRVSEDQRHLVTERGEPFFWLGDTAWELFHRTTREEAFLYLENRAAKGFNVVQAVALAELDGLQVPNANGDFPLEGMDPSRPNLKYFEHVDTVIRRANELGIYVALLPTWGDKFVKRWGVGPEVFTPENAYTYARFLAERYQQDDIIWILGGDRNPDDTEDSAIVDAMAKAIREVVGHRQLISYHPQGGSSSSDYFNDRDWLDFNLFQSGHWKPDIYNFEMIGKDMVKTPKRPVLDGEPNYEDHPIAWKQGAGCFGSFEVRRAAYWSILSGAFGHTYGNHNIWQFWQPGRDAISWARTPWTQAMDYPGAFQMGVMKQLFESLDWQQMQADDAAVQNYFFDEPAKIKAAVAVNGQFAVVYTPYGYSFDFDRSKLNNSRSLTARWADPRTGHCIFIGFIPLEPSLLHFDPPMDPHRGNDWVLIIETDKVE